MGWVGIIGGNARVHITTAARPYHNDWLRCNGRVATTGDCETWVVGGGWKGREIFPDCRDTRTHARQKHDSVPSKGGGVKSQSPQQTTKHSDQQPPAASPLTSHSIQGGLVSVQAPS